MLGRDNEAISDLERAIELSPGKPYPIVALASEKLMVGELEDAKALLAEANKISLTDNAIGTLGSIHFLEGNYQLAKESFTQLTKGISPRERSRGYEMLADLAAEQGYYQHAIDALNLGMQEDSAQGNLPATSSKLYGRAWMEAKLGQFPACSEDLKHALKLDSSPQVILAVESVLGQTIQIAPASIAPMLRRQMIKLSHSIPNSDYGTITTILKMRSHAESELAKGEVEQALKDFRNLAAINIPADSREYLGRALVAAANVRPNSEASLPLLHQAEDAYATIVQHPAIVWQLPYTYLPGTVSDHLQSLNQIRRRGRDKQYDVNRNGTAEIPERKHADN